MWKALALCFFAVLVCFERSDCRADTPSNTLEYRIAPNGDAMMVPIRVGPDLYSFLLDTGAAHNAIDPSLSRLLKMDTAVPKSSAAGSVLYACAGCILDGSNVEVNGSFLVQDLAPLRAVSGHPIYGIIGIEFLTRFRILVDQDRGILRLEQPSDIGLESGRPIEIDSFGRPMCKIGLGNAESISFVIDTGMILPGLGEMEKSVYENLASQHVITPIRSIA